MHPFLKSVDCRTICFLHLGEFVSLGIGRMKELINGAELPDPIFLKEGIFTVIFQRPVRSSQKSSQKIIEIILENASVSTNEMAVIIGISRRAVAKQIAKLKKQGIIDREGSDKSGIWIIIKDAENE